MYILVDPPTTFAPIDEWKEFLANMQKKPQTEEVLDAIRLARTVIAERETEEVNLNGANY